MPNTMNLSAVSDDELLRRLSAILGRVRRDEAELITHIAEVDARGAYAREAVSSMFAYCVEVLHLSEPEAGLRIHVARTCRKHAGLLEMLRDGRIHLSGISLLAPVLTPENRAILLKRASHQPKSRIEEIVAELKPRPRSAVVVRRLSRRRDEAGGRAHASGLPAEVLPALEPGPGSEAAPAAVGNPATATPPLPERRPDGETQPAAVSGPTRPEHRPDDARGRRFALNTPASRVEPVAPRSYRIHFTAPADLKDKLERLQALMRRSVPDGDLGRIIDLAITEKLERLEARRFARTKSPRKSLRETNTTPRSRHIPAPVRRAVHDRDGGRCTYRDKHGRRCTETRHLEYHHRVPFGKGGGHRPDNLTLHCPLHNNLAAERDYGKEVMQSHRESHRHRPSSALPERTPAGPVSRKRGHG